ncbi:MAG: alkaline phosphatase family protein [Acidimicrobiales bacterium]|nr:alkaline phosphatase family protein [Acidimicrobiales bacterium]
MPREVAGAEPRTLLLALDAVPFRVAAEACRRGAFAGWPPPSALVAPFPTVTHVAFASLFLPFGAAPSRRYELRHFDSIANTTVGGGPLAYGRDVPPWSEYLDAPHRDLVSELSNYVSPRRAARSGLDEIEREVLASDRDVVVAYLGATDGLMHLYGDESVLDFLGELDERLAGLGRRHREERGRPLRIVLFSDHGCGSCEIRHAGGFDRLLRDAGLRVVDRLEGPDDVVAPRFGLVNYGALFLRDADRADTAARAIARHHAVELAAFSPGPNLVEVVSGAGRGRVRWHGPAGAARYAYEDVGGDPLRLTGARRRLAAGGLLDPAGYAGDDEWLRETAFEHFPDPLRRLAQALTGDRIQSRANVLFSLGPCWSWGLYSAVVGAWVRGGRLEGTHGGLDRESSLGFFLADDPTLAMPLVVRADEALAPLADAVSRTPASAPTRRGPAEPGRRG